MNTREEYCKYCKYSVDEECSYCNGFGKRLLLDVPGRTYYFQYQDETCEICNGTCKVKEEIITIKEDMFKKRYKDVKVNIHECKSCFGKGHQLRMVIKSDCNYCKIEENITEYRKTRKWYRLFKAYAYEYQILCPKCFSTGSTEKYDIEIYMDKEDIKKLEEKELQ